MRNHPIFNIAQDKQPLVLGHRGVPTIIQENTLAGFKKGLELGLDGFELDVFLTKDKQLVVFHDANALRLTGHDGMIEEMTLEEVQALNVLKTIEYGGVTYNYEREEKIPLFSDVLDLVAGKAILDVELKGRCWIEPVKQDMEVGAAVAKAIQEHKAQDWCYVTSFSWWALDGLERECPGIHSGFTYDDAHHNKLAGFWGWVDAVSPRSQTLLQKDGQEEMRFIRWLLEEDKVGERLGSTVANVEWNLLDLDTIEAFHKRSMGLGTYTLWDINESAAEQAKRKEHFLTLAKAGIDWVITDHPEMVVGWRREWKESAAES